MKRIAILSCLSACTAALSFAGCSNVAAPGAGSRAVATHTVPMNDFNNFDYSAPTHVLTWAWIEHSDNIAPAQAAPYVNWAAVQVADANAFSNAGIKTAFYTNPNRTYP